MNKEELEKQISLLQERVEANKVMNQGYESDLLKAKKDLEDLNKPELTPLMMDNIYEAIERAVEQYDFSDTDNFDIEYGIEYDGKVHCESHEINNTTDLVEAISEKVCNLFKEADCPEDDNS